MVIFIHQQQNHFNTLNWSGWQVKEYGSSPTLLEMNHILTVDAELVFKALKQALQ